MAREPVEIERHYGGLAVIALTYGDDAVQSITLTNKTKGFMHVVLEQGKERFERFITAGTKEQREELPQGAFTVRWTDEEKPKPIHDFTFYSLVHGHSVAG